MDETIILPSPNWYQTSVMAVSSDNWLVYGGPSKSLCILEPTPENSGGIIQRAQGYQAHVLNRAHNEKIISVDISPEWPEKRAVLTGSSDGTVKQWVIDKTEQTLKLKLSHSHDIHHHEKEEAIGVGYCDNGYAVTVGSFGHIVKWDLNSNVVKSYNQVLKSFKPTCMACSPHLNLHVAIGTKQGVVFLLDLNGAARVVYKVRGQDDEILNIGWCPQFEVIVRKALKESKKKLTTSVATERLQNIRQEPEDPEVEKELDKRVKEAENCPDKAELVEEATKQDTEIKENLTETNNETTKVTDPKNDAVDESGIERTLPVDSFDESVVQEDDMFDIYKDHEADEFGHKKFQPETVIVKVKDEGVEEDYLTECQKLKEEILKRKNDTETSIGALVDAMDRAHVDVETQREDCASNNAETPSNDSPSDNVETPIHNASANEASEAETEDVKEAKEVTSAHIHRHLLATIGRNGSVRIWSKSGKQVASCAIASTGGGPRNQRNNNNWTTLLWCAPRRLLLADGKGQLLECNPFKIDCKNKLEWRVLHNLHKRGICAMTSTAPRKQDPASAESDQSPWLVWTTSQDRNLIGYSLRDRQPVEVYNTCGGFLYAIESCPYDARRVAISVGDGAVRIWECDTLVDDSKLTPGRVLQFWANVQGKVLTTAWHPTRENWLAFGTGEARIGLLDVSGKTEKPAKVLVPALSGAVYSLCWGADNDLYACGSGELVVYKTDKPDDAPLPLKVELEGAPWSVSEARWSPRALLVGSLAGAVAALHPTQHHVLAATFIFRKMIHTIAWHPQQTSLSSTQSPHRNLIAVCSLDKVNVVIIVEYKDDGIKQLSTFQTLFGHTGSVLQVAWSPHAEGQLLSSSHDNTVRIWNAVDGVCISIFGGHRQTTLGAAWCPFPQFSGAVLSGGGDCCLRLWDVAHHPADQYQEDKTELLAKKEKKDKKKKEKYEKNKPDEAPPAQEDLATEDQGVKPDKSYRKFLLPMLERQMSKCKINAPKLMLRKYLENTSGENGEEKKEKKQEEYELDYLKIFGSINEVNEVLDGELERHQDTGNEESWMTLCIFRGHIDAMVQRASQRDLLDPYLVGIAPCVSLKYWKDVSQLYIAQIDRQVAKNDEKKLTLSKSYGGPVYRKASLLLSLHDVRGAVTVLTEAKLFKEAYMLCRVRYIDSIAEETLRGWAKHCVICDKLNMAAVCYIALGDISEAAATLGKSTDEEALSFAADLAKMVGQNTFASHIEEKKVKIASSKETEVQGEPLPDLPSRVDVIVRKNEEISIGEDVEIEDVTVEGFTVEELTSKIELLMKENEDNTHKGDGDGIQKENEDNTHKGAGDGIQKENEDNTHKGAGDGIQKENEDNTHKGAGDGIQKENEDNTHKGADDGIQKENEDNAHKGAGDGIQNGDIKKNGLENVEVINESQANGEEARV